MKKEVALRILEENRRKNIANIKNTIYWIVTTMLLIILIYVGTDSVIANKQDKEYAAKVRSTLQSGPIQTMLPRQEKIELKGAEITKLARYDITGKVKGMEFFYFSGGTSKISQQDLTLCWGPASLEQYQNDIKYKYTINDRTAFFSVDGKYYSKYGESGLNYISNNHIIPMNSAVKSRLKKVRNGDTVQMLGWLVSCKGKNWTWGPSSLVRTDRGNGACEIVLVEYLKIIN